MPPASAPPATARGGAQTSRGDKSARAPSTGAKDRPAGKAEGAEKPKGDAKGEGIAATVEFDQGEPNAFLLLDVETPAPGKGSLFARFVNAKGERFHTVQLSLDSLRRTR